MVTQVLQQWLGKWRLGTTTKERRRPNAADGTPKVGDFIACSNVMIQIPKRLGSADWGWLEQRGWHLVYPATDRRRYKRLRDSQLGQLLRADASQRDELLDQLLAHGRQP